MLLIVFKKCDELVSYIVSVDDYCNVGWKYAYLTTLNQHFVALCYGIEHCFLTFFLYEEYMSFF